MDVTFTNVLEGARQYFQGLPTATTGSTVGPRLYPNQETHHNNETDQQKSNQQSPTNGGGANSSSNNNNGGGAYWPPQQEVRRDQTPVHQIHTETRSHYPTNYQQQSQQFHFSRPQSREAPSNVSHSYQQSYQAQQARAPSRQDQVVVSSSSQTYHQMQPSTAQGYHYPQQQMQNHQQVQQNQQQQQQNQQQQQQRSYYPVNTQAKSQPVNSYKIPATQPNVDNTYYKHIYCQSSSTQMTTSMHYAKPQDNKSYEQQGNGNQNNHSTSQSYRTTHNLPPIAALSSINYHSNRNNRDILRSSVANTTKQRTITSTSVNACTTNKITGASLIPQQQQTVRYSAENQDYRHNYNQQQNRLPVNQNYQYGTTTTTTQSYSQVIMTTSNSNNYTTQSQTSSSSSYYQNKMNQEQRIVQQTPQQAQQQQQQQPQPQQQQQQQQQQQIVDHRLPVGVLKAKRESPLDLSVKTVRTPADSTLDDVEHDRTKYYNNTRQISTHNYPTYDMYANSFQRNLNARPQQQSATAPKVEFHPNFQTLNNNNYRRSQQNDKSHIYQNQTNRYPTVSVPSVAHVNSYIQSGQPKRPPVENLPRIDFPTPGHGHKTAALYPAPNHDVQKKRPADVAPPALIPNKITKVDSWRQTIDQQIEQRFSSYKQQMQQQQMKNNGSVNKLVNNSSYPTNQDKSKEMYTYQKYQYTNHNQTYIPSAVAHHQYPGYGNYANYQRPSPQKPNSLGGGADKRVLSLLRNSLEIKGAKEAQKKLEQEKLNRSYDNLHLQQSRLDIQHPSTDVTAPLQPKPGFISRHNVSPFTPTNFPDNNSSIYKLHIPKAIDSVSFESSETTKVISDDTNSHLNPNGGGDLDGLAAFLAARIRTKAELKQVGPSQNNIQENKTSKQDVYSQNGSSSSGSPPKLMKERHQFPPRRRLFSRGEDESGNNVPWRDKSGLRSSSETSVFDFPDTDSESEMPVLEKQTLGDMRRDRKTTIKLNLDDRNDDEDDFFTQTCESFMEQLKNGSGKKRGRRKKMLEADVLAKLETVTKENPVDDLTIKDEVKKEEDDDSDVPLINCKKKIDELKCETQIKQEEQEEKVEEPKTPTKEVIVRPAKKPNFGDGSHFYPGWEEEVYKYKKSLRMPPGLIQVTRPPSCHRLSTSLPDLDPCPNSPTPSVIVELSDPKKLKKEIDSDSESSSYNLFSKKGYDSEGGSSIRSLPNNSFLDKLLERYGGKRKRKYKKVDENRPKIIPKPEKIVDLLPTPIIKKVESLGFRKKTIDNFKQVFLDRANDVTKSNDYLLNSPRTRKQNRVMKQRATIKEVFGEDRPASAPPVTCVDKIKEELTDDIEEDNIVLSKMMKSDHLADTKQVLKNKLLNRNRNENLLKSLVDKKIKLEIDQDQEDDLMCDLIKHDFYSKSETPSIDDGEEGERRLKKNKFTKIRRKLSSGFDYIRKKKKQIKKEDDIVINNNINNNKTKRRGLVSKSNPESVQDIQKEIKTWVLNKGIGETHLHRSARLGYTDIAAYCLEKMECLPSPKDNAGYTPLHEASARGHLDIAKLLLLYGANVSESARGGIRPLHEAVENGYVEVVRLLLSYGADAVLATYSGMTPLALATDDATIKLLQSHINDMQGRPTSPFAFGGPASCFDLKETGFDLLDGAPEPDSVSEEEDVEFEVSDTLLPNLYTLRGEAQNDRWILLQDLSNMLKIKSRDALLRQICAQQTNCTINNVTTTTTTTTLNYKSVLRELKMTDFLEQAHCCQFLNIGEKINIRASKIALVKYTDKVRELLNVEKCLISAR